MGFSLFKDKPEDVAGVMFAAIMGFVDGFWLPVNNKQNKYNLAEIYILANWQQVISLITAGGGATNRVMKVIEIYSKETHLRAIDYFLDSGRLRQADAPDFVTYISEHAPMRRQQYDATYRDRNNNNYWHVAEIALTQIVNGTMDRVETAQAEEALRRILITTGKDSVSRLQRML